MACPLDARCPLTLTLSPKGAREPAVIKRSVFQCCCDSLYHAWVRRAPGLRAQANARHAAPTLPLAALARALRHRRPPAGLVHHSDQGVQYASATYRQRLTQAGVIPSMSRRSNGYDNAMMESFWSTLKRELVHRFTFATRAEAPTAKLRVERSLLQPRAVPPRPRFQIPCEL